MCVGWGGGWGGLHPASPRVSLRESPVRGRQNIPETTLRRRSETTSRAALAVHPSRPGAGITMQILTDQGAGRCDVGWVPLPLRWRCQSCRWGIYRRRLADAFSVKAMLGLR